MAPESIIREASRAIVEYEDLHDLIDVHARKVEKKEVVYSFNADSGVEKYSFLIAKDVRLVLNSLDQSRKTAEIGDVIITGPELETYPVSRKKIATSGGEIDGDTVILYFLSDNEETLTVNPRPARTVYRVKEGVNPFRIRSPWAEGTMDVNAGDYVVKDKQNFYRIDKDAFEATYEDYDGAPIAGAAPGPPQ